MVGGTRGQMVLNLFDQHYERVYWFARRSVDAPTAEDVAQEVFVRLLRIADLESRIVNSSYLLKVADNLIKRRHKQNVRQERFARSHSCEECGASLDYRETAPAESFDNLSDGERDALRLIVCEGLSYQAAAKALDVKVSTLNNWKFRGMRKLRGEDCDDLDSLAG